MVVARAQIEMHRINLFTFYQARAHINTLRNLTTADELSTPHSKLELAVSGLRNLQKEAKLVPWANTNRALRAVLQCGRELQEQINLFFLSKTETIVTDAGLRKMKTLLDDFEREFEHDSREINIISV